MNKKLMILGLGLVVLVSLVGARNVHADLNDDPWPMFRHDVKHTGQSPYNGPETPELKWRYPTGDWIYSSPAIANDGSIYVGSLDEYLYALNPDGTLKWRYHVGSSYSGVYSSPAIANDGTIYVGSGDDYLYALNPDGTLKWRYLTGGNVESSPAIASDGTIYVGSWDHYLYALNTDGTLKWRYQTSNNIEFSSPAISNDGTIYVTSWDSYLYALNPDGTLKWIYQMAYWLESSPVIASDGTIYVGSHSFNKLFALNPEGTVKWMYHFGSYVDSSPAIASDGTIFVDTGGYLYALNPDGTLKWRYETTGGGFSSPAIATDGTIYIGSSDDYLYAIGTVATQPPAAPTNLVATAGNTQVSLTWNISSGATGYKVYYDVDSGEPYANSIDVGNVTSYTVTGLTNGTTYYFAVTAYNSYGESSYSNEVSSTPLQLPPWTFMVYLNGDNNLEPNAIDDFLEMANIGSTEDVNIVVQMDRISWERLYQYYLSLGYPPEEAAQRANEADSSDYGDWEKCHRFHIMQGMGPWEESAITDWGDGQGGREVDMGDQQTLIDFATWAIDNYSAQRYALVVWNHGNGWYDRGKTKLNYGFDAISDDWTDGGTISISEGEWEQAISTITDEDHLGRKIELIGFDACLMQMIEVEYINKAYADFMVGSEEKQGLQGWAYDCFLDDLVANPEMSASILGEAIVNTAIDDTGLATQSLIDLSRIDGVVNKIKEFASELITAVQNGYGDEIAGIRDDVQEFDLPSPDYEHIDLYDFARRIHKETGGLFNEGLPQTLIAAANDLMVSLDNAIVLARHKSGLSRIFFNYEHAYGIAIYYPEDPDNYNINYDMLSFAQDTPWDDFILLDYLRINGGE